MEWIPLQWQVKVPELEGIGGRGEGKKEGKGKDRELGWECPPTIFCLKVALLTCTLAI